MTSAAVVIVSYNTRELTLRCLASLQASRERPQETIVVDNASTDGSVEAIAAAFPNVVVVANDSNVGFARAVNQGVGRCAAEIVVLLNPDATVATETLGQLCEALAANEHLAAVGPSLVDERGAVQHHCAAAELSVLGQVAWRLRLPRSPAPLLGPRCGPHGTRFTQRLSGAALAVRREIWMKLGGFDEHFFMYFEDADLCVRLRRAGHELACVTHARVIHAEGGSSSRDPRARDERAFRSELMYFRKHGGAPAAAALRAGVAAASAARALGFALSWARRKSGPERMRSELHALARCLKG